MQHRGKQDRGEEQTGLLAGGLDSATVRAEHASHSRRRDMPRVRLEKHWSGPRICSCACEVSPKLFHSCSGVVERKGPSEPPDWCADISPKMPQLGDSNEPSQPRWLRAGEPSSGTELKLGRVGRKSLFLLTWDTCAPTMEAHCYGTGKGTDGSRETLLYGCELSVSKQCSCRSLQWWGEAQDGGRHKPSGLPWQMLKLRSATGGSAGRPIISVGGNA